MPVINGTNGPDTLSGTSGDDALYGLDDNDSLTGGLGNDTLDGGSGNDTALYNSATAAVTVNLINGTASGGAGNDRLISIEQVYGSAYDDVLTGGNPANGISYFDGFEGFRGNAGNDTMDGGGGYDRVRYDNSPAAVAVTLGGSGAGSAQDGFGGTDVLYNIEEVRGSAFNDALTGSDSGIYESFEGLAGNDSMDGKGGQDRASYSQSPAAVSVNLALGSASDGWGGTDSLQHIEDARGSDYNDTLTGNDQNNILEGRLGNDTLDGGAGSDTASYENAPTAVNVSLVSNSSSGGDGNDLLVNMENIYGSDFNDVLTGNAGDNRLRGNAGNDTLDGGAGSDTADYYHALGPVTVDLATRSSLGADGNDVLLNMENIRGSYVYGDSLGGDSGNNSIDGAGGDDSIWGGGGNDTLVGGTGDDVTGYSGKVSEYGVSYSSATATFTIADKVANRDGTDQVSSVEHFNFIDANLTLAQLLALATATPDTTAPTLVSTSPANGAVGVSPSGDISFNFSEAVSLGSGEIQLLDSGGKVVTSYNAATGGGGALSVSGSTLTIHPGSALAAVSGYTLVLPAGSVKDLAGNAFAGSTGYHFTTAGSGVTQTATASAPNLTGGTGDDTLIAGSGNGTLDGGAGNDVLQGGSGHTQMLGGSGNDTLISGTGGGDTMQGGDGADLYYVNSTGDVVTETAANAAQPLDPNHPNTIPDSDLGRSVDKVIASINYTLTSFVENLSLASASGNLTGSGNDLNNELYGNEGNNVLNGKGGNDTLDGGAGLDTAQYSGKLADYTLALGSGATTTTTTTVTDKTASRDGVDSLTNIERLQFSDSRLALDMGASQAGGKTVLMMAVATSLGKDFVGVPSFAGLFLGFFDSGASLLDGATLLVSSGIVAAFAGGADNASVVKMIYTDVYGKAPDAATLASLVAPLAAGTTTQAQWMADMAASTANQQHVGLVGYAGTGLQFTV